MIDNRYWLQPPDDVRTTSDALEWLAVQGPGCWSYVRLDRLVRRHIDVLPVLMSPLLDGIKGLDLDGAGLGRAGVEALACAPHLSSLEMLDLSTNDVDAVSMASLAQSPYLTHLRMLAVRNNQIGDAGVAALARSSTFVSLTDLDLSNASITGMGMRAFLDARSLPRLHTLSLSDNPRIGPTGGSVLATAPPFQRLHHVNLVRTTLGDQGLASLVRSPSAQHLVHLNVYDNGIGAEGTAALAESPYLHALVHLDLSGNHVGASGAHSLAGARALPALRVLRVPYNKIPADGLRAFVTSPLLNHVTLLDLLGNDVDADLEQAFATAPALKGRADLCEVRGIGRHQGKHYSYKDLIDAYNVTQQTHPAEEITRFYARRLDALEKCFNIKLDMSGMRRDPPPGVQRTVLWMVFQSALASYRSIRTPWSDFIAMGLGAALLAAEYGGEVSYLAAQSREAHREVIDALFRLMYGEITRLVTSEDLLEVGFNDKDEERMRDLEAEYS